MVCLVGWVRHWWEHCFSFRTFLIRTCRPPVRARDHLTKQTDRSDNSTAAQPDGLADTRSQPSDQWFGALDLAQPVNCLSGILLFNWWSDSSISFYINFLLFFNFSIIFKLVYICEAASVYLLYLSIVFFLAL